MARIRNVRRASMLAMLSALALAGCHRNDDIAEATATDVPQTLGGPVNGGNRIAPVENPLATPVKDRVATLGLLNKRNNEETDLVMHSGESRRVGNAVVRLATCEKTAPWERPPETGAFVQLYVEERASLDQPLAWHKVFSGWLFRNAPALNVVEHPVYDVWVKDCAMKFPGEEENPADDAAASKASKAAGKASTAAADSADTSPPPPSPGAPVEGDAGEVPGN